MGVPLWLVILAILRIALTTSRVSGTIHAQYNAAPYR
jgi:hypothetical protein